MTHEQLRFELQCPSVLVSEIAVDGDWLGDSGIEVSEEELAEMTKGDDKPFFVEFIALHEGLSNNNRLYTDDAVKSCPEAMLGVNMYKGHEEPGTNSWKYREPVGKIVAAKLDRIDIGEKKGVLCAKGKAYITEADPKLRADIKKKMAGNVSILGNARMVRKLGDPQRTVTALHKPLKSVDFCNPGTGGMPAAGVTAVVSEMAGEVIETQTETETKDGQEMSAIKKLTRDELLAEYGSVITDIVSEQVGDRLDDVTKQRTELHDAKEAFKTEKTEFEGSISEMKTQIEDLTKTNEDLQSQLDTEREQRIGAELSQFVTEHVAEMRGMEGVDEKLVDMASKRVGDAKVIELDLDKSKAAFTSAFKTEFDMVSEMAASFGAPNKGDEDDDGESNTTNHKNNPKGKSKKKGLERFLSPELRANREKRLAGTR